MKRPFRKLTLIRLVFTLAAVWLCLGCAARKPAGGSSAAPNGGAQKPLRVGVAETMPPIIFLQNDEPVGVEADMARRLAATLGREVRFVSMYLPNLIMELRSRRIDIIMSGLTVTPERGRYVSFCEPYLLIGQKAMIRREDRVELGTEAAIRSTDRPIGLEVGSTGLWYAHRNLTQARKLHFTTIAKATEALLDEGVDFVIHDSPSIDWLASNDERLLSVPGLLTRESLAWAVHKQDTDLLDSANAALRQWRSDGTLTAILERWTSH